jgi:hypothetical protein
MEHVTKCLGKTEDEGVEKTLQNPAEHQKASLFTVTQSLSSNISMAFKVADNISLDFFSKVTSDDIKNSVIISIVELILLIVEKHMKGVPQTHAISSIGQNKQGFIDAINEDQRVAVQLANQSGLEYTDPLRAVYHYRKHGPDFPSQVRLQNPIEVYLNHVPDNLITDASFVETLTFQVIQLLFCKAEY